MRPETSSPAIRDKLLNRDYSELKRLFWKYRLKVILTLIFDIAVDEGVSLRRLAMAYEDMARDIRHQLGDAE